MADDNEKNWFEKFKAVCEIITMGKAPWWVVPLAVVALVAIVF